MKQASRSGSNGNLGQPRLRALQPTDRAAIARLGASLFRPFGDYSVAIPDWLRRPGVWGRVLDDGAGQPVGLALVTVLRGRSREHHGYVLAIGVADQLQGQGWGHRLLEQGLDELRKQKQRFELKTVHLTVASKNQRAIKLFEAAGFHPMPHEIEHYQDGQRAIRLMRLLDREGEPTR